MSDLTPRTLIAFALTGLLLSIAGCKPSSTAALSALGAQSDLQSFDLAGSARLKGPERDGAIERCSKRSNTLAGPINMRGAGTVNLTSLRASIADFYRPFCDCFVNELEDRSSKMQFKMTMSLLDQAHDITRNGSVPEFANFRMVAAKHGMTSADFERARSQLHPIARASAGVCYSRLTGQ
jgi:hypothetical protein